MPPDRGGGGGGTLNFSCYVDLDQAFPHSKKVSEVSDIPINN